MVVYLTLVENLIYKSQQPLCIAVDGVYGRRCLCLLRFSSLFCTIYGTQFAQRRHDESERRAKVMGGVDKELHLSILQLALASLAIEVEAIGKSSKEEQRIDKICKA